MLHGKGSQAFITKSFEKERQKGLEDRDKLSIEEREIYGIVGSLGGGKTDSDTYTIQQFPFPTDTAIRRPQDIDIRKVDPRIGEMSD